MSQAANRLSQGSARRQDFAMAADRERLTRVGLEAFRRVAEAWKLTGDESAALLGVSSSTWDRIKTGAREEKLSQDQLTRVSAIVGTYKGLHLLFADHFADDWPRLANAGPMFAGQTPVRAMIAGGIPVMLDVRRLIDAVRGGL